MRRSRDQKMVCGIRSGWPVVRMRRQETRKKNLNKMKQDSYFLLREYSGVGERVEILPHRIKNVALQAPCYSCAKQAAYIDRNGIIRCHEYDECKKVIHYAKAVYQYLDPDFDDIMYARCGNCGQMLYRPGERTKCPSCGYEIIWDKEEPI